MAGSIQVGSVESRVEVSDHEQLLSPLVLERIVREVLRRLHEEQGHAARVAAERRVAGGPPSESEQP